MLAYVTDVLFVALALYLLAIYRQLPTPVRYALLMIFGTRAVFFLRDLLVRTGVGLPVWLNDLMLVLVFSHGALVTLRMSQLQAIRRWRVRLAIGAYLACVVLICATGSPMPLPAVVTVVVLTGLIGTGLCAGLLEEVRRRTGSAFVRYLFGTLEAALFTLALVLSPFGSSPPDLAGPLPNAAAIAALLSVICYAVALAGPPWLRRLWSMPAVYRSSQKLARAGMGRAEDAWRRYAAVVHETRGDDAVLVLLRSDEGYVEVAGVGIDIRPDVVHDARLLDGLAAEPGMAVLADAPADLANRSDARLIMAGTFQVPPGTRGALLLFTDHRSLFVGDDLALLAEVATQAVILSERSTVLAAQRELAERLSSSVRALTAANRAKTEFLAKMSHELRTPLNAIIGFSDLMSREPAEDERLRVPVEWVTHINGSGRHLLELINDMLDLAKVEAGRIDLRPEPLDVRAAVEAAVSAQRPLMVRKQLGLYLDADRCTVLADRVRLRQILDNLLSNAIKFTAAGGRITVTARCSHDAKGGEQWVELAVADTGVGIAAADHARVFEEFQQVGDRAAQVGGTGLGLALVRRLAQAHGGEIGLESELGVGSTFTVRLPAAQSASQAPPEPGAPVTDSPATEEPATDAPPTDRPDGGVLVIEDDVFAVRLLYAYLDGAGYRTRVALDGASGLAEARREPPAAIVLDVVLPVTDGWEVLRELKVDPVTRDVPVVMVTMVDEHELGLALGAVDYLVKPIDPEVLLGVLRRHVPREPGSDGVRTALVIDDDPACLELIAVCLGREGVAVHTAGSGADGLRMARERRFDVVVCDLVMPDIDGYAVIAELQADPHTNRTPILVVTGQDLSEQDKQRLNGEILAVLQKGDGLQELIGQWLRRVTGSESLARTP